MVVTLEKEGVLLSLGMRLALTVCPNMVNLEKDGARMRIQRAFPYNQKPSFEGSFEGQARAGPPCLRVKLSRPS